MFQSALKSSPQSDNFNTLHSNLKNGAVSHTLHQTRLGYVICEISTAQQTFRLLESVIVTTVTAEPCPFHFDSKRLI
jgi:hypothetical protein